MGYFREEKIMKNVSLTSIDNTIWDIKSKISKKHTINESESFISPLVYYINTGRAPTEFLRIFVNLSERQKNTIANRLENNAGNTEAAINSVCQYIGFKRNCL